MAGLPVKLAFSLVALVAAGQTATCDTASCEADSEKNNLAHAKRESVLMQVAWQKLEQAKAEDKAKVAVQRESVLMQVQKVAHRTDQIRANAVADTALSDAAVAEHIRSLSFDAAKVGSVIRCGIQAILNSITHFTAEPPNVFEGIVQLGRDLFNCIKDLIGPLLEKIMGSDLAEGQWQDSFQIIGSVESIVVDIKDYIATGDPPPLVRAIGSILVEAGSLISSFLPQETGTEIRKYLDAVSGVFEAMGTSWDAFAKGRTAEGIESIYLSLKGVTDDLLLDAWKNNTIYVSVAAILDTVLGNLSQHVLEYERRLMEANVCWRAEKHRERMRPELCPEGYAAGGHGYCYRLASLQQQEVATLDTAVLGKKADRPRGSIPARCDSSSRFTEKHGQFCYSTCDNGFEPKSHAKCISKCEGKFPAETPAMCGHDKGMAIKAIMEMVTTVLNAGFSLSENIIKMKEHGVEATSLSTTVQVFIDMGKPFANPICPVSTETTAAPLPTASPSQRVNPMPTEAIADPSPTTNPLEDQMAPHGKPTCSMGQKVFVSSHRQEQLQDRHGHARFTKNKNKWEQWTLSDAGDGKVFITSHRGAQLADHQGNVVMSWRKRNWERWQLTDAGNGKVYITSHQNKHLQDNADRAKLSSNAGNWEAFMITDIDGGNGCTLEPKLN